MLVKNIDVIVIFKVKVGTKMLYSNITGIEDSKSTSSEGKEGQERTLEISSYEELQEDFIHQSGRYIQD